MTIVCLFYFDAGPVQADMSGEGEGAVFHSVVHPQAQGDQWDSVRA